ncbi:YbaN family protein [Aeromonas simiae]|uniref:YbaN family protein n=1 Tax=Aeromonas simiae TaxID=218936 RepID=UPI0005A5D358|nr:YbaN family protein [Aeromonas simiae]MDO2948002.1 YbaN family protein [Aeromonas simiae]MDO2952253.1 YbaN family protein [Aeromonas simiae]MDO2955385.1 YbaN family protein [Aeromonas simiae]
MNALLTLLGWLSLITGIIGIVVPLLPTTPFVLLSAALFARSSPRFHRWLLDHPQFGPLIDDWQRHRGIRRSARRRANLLILLSFGVSLLLVPSVWLRVLLLVMMVGLLVIINRLPLVEPVALKQ